MSLKLLKNIDKESPGYKVDVDLCIKNIDKESPGYKVDVDLCIKNVDKKSPGYNVDVDLCIKNIDKESPGYNVDVDLCKAVQSNDLNLVIRLLEENKDLSSSSLHFAIWYAIAHKYDSLVSYLLEKGDYMNRYEAKEIFYDQQLELLSWAKHYKNDFVTERLLKHMVKLNNFNEPRVGPLYYSIKKKFLEITLLLLQYGASTNCKDDSGNSLLHMAAATGMPEFIDFLKKYKPDPNSTNNFGQNALHYAVQSPYHNRIVLMKLIELGIPIDGLDANGETPLHYALTLRKLKMARFLIDNGANVTLESHNNVDPLYISVVNKSLKLAILILSKGFNANKILADGNTALHIACKNHQRKLVSSLLEFKADVDLRNSEQKVPLALIKNNKSKAAKILTRHIALKSKYHRASKQNLQIINAASELRQIYKKYLPHKA